MRLKGGEVKSWPTLGKGDGVGDGGGRFAGCLHYLLEPPNSSIRFEGASVC